MNGKEISHLEALRALFRRQNGLVSAADLAREGIPRLYLTFLCRKGEILRMDRGLYATPESLVDQMAGLQARYKSAIFSHETALYLLGVSERSPLFYSLTVPSGYNATSLKESGTRVYFVQRQLYELGSVNIRSPYGNEISAFGLERTLCDILRSRNQLDAALVPLAFKRYVSRTDKNIDLLCQYAEKFSIQKRLRAYLEVLL